MFCWYVHFILVYVALISALASGDIRNLIETVNGLPKHYQGKCDILLNDIDPIVVNRNLIILFALLGSGPSMDEAAELATHLMYSAASSCRRCLLCATLHRLRLWFQL